MKHKLICRCFLILLLGIASINLPGWGRAWAQDKVEKKGVGSKRASTPSFADVIYQEGHPQNVLDIWLADSAKPTPLAVFIHGGGYRGGSKRVPPATVKKFLEAGVSVAAVEYRFVQHAKLPAAHHDCRRAIQFLRSKSSDWNLNPERFGAWGGSAGAQLCMYLAFHDEMADPESRDPVARESTRLHCISINGGQTTMDLDLFEAWIPGYTEPHRTTVEYFGEQSEDDLKKLLTDVSAIDLLSADDPPIYMTYRMRPGDPVPAGAKAKGWKIHHVVFGVKLKERADGLGVESHLIYPGNQSGDFDSVEHFLITKLQD